MISDFRTFMAQIAEVKKPCLFVYLVQTTLYYSNWSFFPGVFPLHISSKPMCRFEHSIEIRSHRPLPLGCQASWLIWLSWCCALIILFIYENTKNTILGVNVKHWKSGWKLTNKLLFIYCHPIGIYEDGRLCAQVRLCLNYLFVNLFMWMTSSGNNF